MVYKWQKFEMWLAREFIGGHFSIGPVVFYGMNAMAFAVNVKTSRWGTVCFRPTSYFWGRWRRWYFYVSPDGTPQRSTFAIGPGIDELTKVMALVRRFCFGHNFYFSDDFCDWNGDMANYFESLYMANRPEK